MTNTLKKYRVEFNTTGFYSGQGVFETLDEIAEVEAENAQEAIELTIDWMIHSTYDMWNADEENAPEGFINADGELDFDRVEDHVREFAWRAQEISHDEYGSVYGDYEYTED